MYRGRQRIRSNNGVDKKDIDGTWIVMVDGSSGEQMVGADVVLISQKVWNFPIQ